MLRHHVDALMARAFPVDFEDTPLLLCGFWLHQEGAIIVPLGRRYPSRINLECKGFVSKRNRHRIMARQRDMSLTYRTQAAIFWHAGEKILHLVGEDMTIT